MKKLDLKLIPAKYRPAPFWSWNDKLEPNELRRQIREMKKAGIGGFFMHARGGLQTAYLSKEWIECVNACLDEARIQGMEGWLYDENGWPSGFGGGIVNGMGVKYQQKYLRVETVSPQEAEKKENTIAFYRTDCSLIGRKLPKNFKEDVLRCYYEVNPYYVDNLDAEVVAKFIECTHKFYYDTIPPELLKYMKGIFTDEPQLSRDGVLWSFILEEEYKKEYDLDLLEELPLLLISAPGSDAVRIRFWRLATKLFSINFMKQIADWCDDHNWLLTGHQVLEENCENQISSNGTIMPIYQYYHVPGIDHLSRCLTNPVTMIQLASVGAQFGKKQLLSESFAMTGWNFNFSGMLWMFNAQLAHGINLLCPHLQSYTLRGLRKRDYPSSNFCHQPWWNDLRPVNDSFSRAGMVMAEGKGKADVLVLHPMSSAWCLYHGVDTDARIVHYSQGLQRLSSELDSRQIQYHYADELLTESNGSVQGKTFRIGKCAYKYVIIPQITNLSANMLELLMQFSKNGGRIFVVSSQQEPEKLTIDGVPASQEARQFLRSLPHVENETAAAETMAKLIPEKVSILSLSSGTPAYRFISTFRDITLADGRRGRFYFINNTDYFHAENVRIALPAVGRSVEYIDPATGELFRVQKVRSRNGFLEFDSVVCPGDAQMFFVSDRPAKDSGKILLEDVKTPAPVKCFDDQFTLKTMKTPNLFTLDRCRYRVDNGSWVSDDVSTILSTLLELQHDCDLELEYQFELAEDFDLSTPLSLISETPERYTFALNGKAFAAKDTGCHFDPAFRVIPLPGNLKKGSNVITMKTRFHQEPETYETLLKAKEFESEYNKLTFDSEVESVYLAGNFAVRHTGRTEQLIRCAERLHGAFTVGSLPENAVVDAGDLVQQGLPFFSGKLVLEKVIDLSAAEADCRYLRFTPVGVNSCSFKVNGKDAGIAFGNHFCIKVEGLLKPGRNIIEVELTTSLRNMLGPHHLQEGESYGVHTMSFTKGTGVAGRQTPPYDAGYCFVRQGIKDLELI